MTNKKIETATEVSALQIQEWKKKYGDVFLVECEGKKAYLKKPDRQILGAASSLSRNNPMQFSETIITNCFLGGDEIFKTDDSYFMALSVQLDSLIDIKVAELKKL